LRQRSALALGLVPRVGSRELDRRVHLLGRSVEESAKASELITQDGKKGRAGPATPRKRQSPAEKDELDCLRAEISSCRAAPAEFNLTIPADCRHAELWLLAARFRSVRQDNGGIAISGPSRHNLSRRGTGGPEARLRHGV